MLLVWAGYGTGLLGWCLRNDYDLTLSQLMNPAHPYSGAWPPAKIPAGQTWPGGVTATASTTAAPAKASTGRGGVLGAIEDIPGVGTVIKIVAG